MIAAPSLRIVRFPLLLACLGGMAAAQPVRRTVTVERPVGMPRTTANLVIDARARAALVESVVAERMSADIVRLRGAEARSAFEPADSLVTSFAVVDRADADSAHVRVICDAEVDVGAALVRLVRSGVVTFGPTPPRILLVPAAETDMGAVKALRSRIRQHLGGAGFDFLAVEDVTPGYVAKRVATTDGRSALAAQGGKVRADLIAVISMLTAAAPSPVGGSILDATLQITVVRPHDRKIVAEQAFQSRGSGATVLLATEALLDDLGPGAARALAQQLTGAVFSEVEVQEPSPAAAKVAPGRPTVAQPRVQLAGGGPEAPRPPLMLHRSIR